jgi:hypothetical protein
VKKWWRGAGRVDDRAGHRRLRRRWQRRPSIVVYNAQHEQLISEIAPDFTKKTGIKVELRNGSDSELAAQLEQEGDASPADVFLTENSPAMSQVERAGLLRRLPDAAWRRSPRSTGRAAACGPASWPARRCWSTTPRR